MHDHTEVYLLSAFAALTFGGFILLGYAPPKDAATAQTMMNATYGIATGAVAALYRALGVNGNRTTDPPTNGLSPKLPGT